MTYEKPITIESITFEEELLPSGRKLLHLIFKQKFGASHYKWTPPWKGDYGVERLFFKALEIEEWNDYDGVWSKELKQASKEIPSLDEIRLPLRILIGEMTEVVDEAKGKRYRVAVEISTNWTEAIVVFTSEEGEKEFIQVDDIKMAWDSLKRLMLKKQIVGISKSIESFMRGIEFDPEGGEHPEEMGVRFYVWLEAGAEKSEYQVIGKELAANIRSFIRKRLSDHQALKRGFEEV